MSTTGSPHNEPAWLECSYATIVIRSLTQSIDPMPVWFMRHGETNYNRLGLCNDDPERNVHLTDVGIRQAEMVAEQLHNHPLIHIYVSELPRTHETADIINRHHHVTIEIEPSLNDIRSGFEGKAVADYQAAIAHDPLHARANNGESLLDYKKRVNRFLDELEKRCMDNVLIIAHEETLRIVAARFRGLQDTVLPGLHFGNCEVLEYFWP